MAYDFKILTDIEQRVLAKARISLAAGDVIMGDQANYVQELIIRDWLHRQEIRKEGTKLIHQGYKLRKSAKLPVSFSSLAAVLIAFSLITFSLPILVNAQTATLASKFVFDQDAPNVATANSYTYKYYLDSAATGIIFNNVVCVNNTTTFICTVSIPAFTPGAHSMTITAGNTGGESAKSVPLTFTMVIIPAVPTNIRIQ